MYTINMRQCNKCGRLMSRFISSWVCSCGNRVKDYEIPYTPMEDPEVLKLQDMVAKKMAMEMGLYYRKSIEEVLNNPDSYMDELTKNPATTITKLLEDLRHEMSKNDILQGSLDKLGEDYKALVNAYNELRDMYRKVKGDLE